MRKIMLLLLLAGVFVAGLAVTSNVAQAYPLPQEFKLKFSDWEWFNPAIAPETGPFCDGIEDNWGIGKIESIHDYDQAGHPMVWHDGQNGEHLRVVYWGLDVESWAVDGKFRTVEATQTLDGWAIPYAGLDFYLWTEGQAGYKDFDITGGPGARTAYDQYPTITDGGALQAKLEFKWGIDPVCSGCDPLLPILTTGTAIGGNPPTGHGSGYLDPIVPEELYGPFAGLLPQFTNPCDDELRYIHMEFDFSIPGDYGWSMNSDDPMIGSVPEPSTMLLLGTGLLGMARYARRRFKK